MRKNSSIRFEVELFLELRLVDGGRDVNGCGTSSQNFSGRRVNRLVRLTARGASFDTLGGSESEGS